MLAGLPIRAKPVALATPGPARVFIAAALLLLLACGSTPPDPGPSGVESFMGTVIRALNDNDPLRLGELIGEPPIRPR